MDGRRGHDRGASSPGHDGELAAPSPAPSPLPGPPVETRLGDLDHDGDLDAIVLLSSPREIGLLRAHGDGTFDPYVTLVSIASGTPTQLEVSDLDVDGNLDAVALVSGAVGVCMGTGSGSFGALTFPTYPAAPPGRFQPQPGPMRLRHLANGSPRLRVRSRLHVPGGFPEGRTATSRRRPDAHFVWRDAGLQHAADRLGFRFWRWVATGCDSDWQHVYLYFAQLGV